MQTTTELLLFVTCRGNTANATHRKTPEKNSDVNARRKVKGNREESTLQNNNMARIIIDAQTQKSRKKWNQLEAEDKFTFTAVDTLLTFEDISKST